MPIGLAVYWHMGDHNPFSKVTEPFLWISSLDYNSRTIWATCRTFTLHMLMWLHKAWSRLHMGDFDKVIKVIGLFCEFGVQMITQELFELAWNSYLQTTDPANGRVLTCTLLTYIEQSFIALFFFSLQFVICKQVLTVDTEIQINTMFACHTWALIS